MDSPSTTLSEPTHCFFVGWYEELIATYTKFLSLTSHVEVAVHPSLYLFETKRGDAVLQLQPLGADTEGASRAHGQLLTPIEGVQASDLFFRITGSNRDTVTETVVRSNGEKVSAIASAKLFPATSVPGCLIHEGLWLERPQPFPLKSVTFDALRQIRYIFAYGTLRHDDTSGASWTKPFNEGMTSVPATVRGISMYLQAYPIILVPRDETVENHGVVGCVATAPTAEAFSEKLAMADRIEGSPGHYRRGVVEAELQDGSRVLAFLYYMMPERVRDMSSLKRSYVASGDYLRRGPGHTYHWDQPRGASASA